jgi:hypothetical protein
MPTPWTCIEEFMNIDLWCLAAWRKPSPASQKTKTYPRIAVEVKVSRSDLKSELHNPNKRAWAYMHSDQFYIAVPKGLLKEDEIEFKQPDFEPADYHRTPCPNGCRKIRNRKGSWYWNPNEPSLTRYKSMGTTVECDLCDGKTWVGKSRVEELCPMVWVPPDVGLIEVDAVGCVFTKYAPVNESREELSPSQVGLLARWVSIRPDPFHADLREQKGLTYREERAKLMPTDEQGGVLVST